ncbi:serine hydrolase FSH [Coniochaeta sp. 2T2.1]|nr:serine hydrolase FSH [Coniochaeta sp. 2T2.1]
MKFLCLPGAYGSAKNFSVQLAPFTQHMGDRGLATFTYTQGEHEVEPPVGWEHYFGSRPVFRFLDSSENDAFEALRRVRQLPRGLTPEATLRLFEKKDSVVPEGFKDKFRAAMNRIRQVIEEDPEIDAILGYSEGAMFAASILYEEHEKWVKHKVPRRLKFGIFFSGTPPLAIEPDGSLVPKLADDCNSVIDVPTFHIFGSNDPLMYSAVALYNVCNQETAMLWDHGLGHLVPRDTVTVTELGDILHDVIFKADKSALAGTDTPVTDFTDFSSESGVSDRSEKF